MSKRKEVKWIPFDINGKLIQRYNDKADDPTYRYNCQLDPGHPIFYKPNSVFDSALTFQGFDMGTWKAYGSRWQDENGVDYYMHMRDLQNLILSGKLNGKTIKAKWTYTVNRGIYGIIIL